MKFVLAFIALVAFLAVAQAGYLSRGYAVPVVGVGYGSHVGYGGYGGLVGYGGYGGHGGYGLGRGYGYGYGYHG